MHILLKNKMERTWVNSINIILKEVKFAATQGVCIKGKKVSGTKHIDFPSHDWNYTWLSWITKKATVLLRGIRSTCAYLDYGHEMQVSLSSRCSFTSHEVGIGLDKNPFTLNVTTIPDCGPGPS